MASEREKVAAAAAGPELRLVDRRALVGFPPIQMAPGILISDFALQIPDVTFPFNLSGGAARFQKKRLHFGFLEVAVDAEVVTRHVAELAGRLLEVEDLKLHFRPGYLEGQARLSAGERPPFTFKVAFDADGEQLVVYLYDVRLYGFSPTPAAALPVVLSRAVEELGLLPGVTRRGATGFAARVLPPLVETAAVGRGYKLPSLEQARLSSAEVSTQGLRLRFAAGGLPPPSAPDEDLLLALEGSRAFADAEALLAENKLAEARAAYLKLGDVFEAHPFAAERLLTLLVADPQAHELALDLAGSLAGRRERSATALWAEAVVRERRGEHARAAERYLSLCALARKSQEEASAFFAAESAARAAKDQAPQMAVRALHELLGLKPDHLPSLKHLAKAADAAQDRAGAIRAYRRIAALARDPSDAAFAHVQMARLCAVTDDDIAGARLHCEAALKLTPDHPDALFLLGELCHRAGEHLRALKALDRLREVALGRHELGRVGQANLLAGKVWEQGLQQPENALLRYREAVSLMPGEPEPLFYAARVAEGLGHVQEAIGGYQQAIELAGPAPRSDDVRRAAHLAHHAMARLSRTRLGDPARAHEHLQAALALDARDMAAIAELLPYFRASGRAAELADALEKAAAITDAPDRRAAFWAEAGELYRGRLGKPDKAERLLAAALESDPHNAVALEGMLALAESRRDGGQLCRCLKALAELAQDPKERARHYRRLSVAARDLAFDLELAAFALNEVIKLEPDDLPALGELCGLQRRRTDMNGLAAALELRARAAEGQGDKRLAAAALRELAQVLEARLGRVGEALVALEKAARMVPEPSALLELADLSLRCERPAHARRALEDLLMTQSAHAAPERVAEIRARLGRACEMLGDNESAKQHYAEAFPFKRLDEQVGTRLEALYREAGQTRELADLWASRAQALLAAERGAEAAPLFMKAGRALLSLGDKAAAVLKLNAALDATTDSAESAEVLDALAQLELERGAKAEAAKLFARRAAFIPDAKAAARIFLKAAALVPGTAREAELLAQALDKDAQLAEARVRRAELLAELDPARALEDLEAALTVPAAATQAISEAERLTLNRRAGLIALKAGRTDAARHHLALYAAHRPDDLDVQRQLAALHRRAGAKEALADVLGELWPRLDEGPEQQQALRELADLSVALGRQASALECLRALFAQDPSDQQTAEQLLAALPEDGEPREALSLISSLLEGAHGHARAELLTRRGRLHRRLGQLDQARADLSDAAQSADAPAIVLRELAELARDVGDERAELDAWRGAVTHNPALAEEAAPRLLALARARKAQGDGEGARTGFEAACRLPLPPAERTEAFWGLADACLALQDTAGAAQAFLDASREGPAKRRADALLKRAELLEKQDARGASESYAAALALTPRDPHATGGLKRTLRAIEDWEALAEVLAGEAQVAAKAAAAPLYAELGRLYEERLSLKGPAEAAYRKAAQLDRADIDVRKRLVHLCAERGELAEMGEMAEEAAQALPAPDAAELLQDAANAAHLRQDRDLTVRLFRKAHALKPLTGDDLYALADLLYVQGAQAEALPLFKALSLKVDFDEGPERAEEVLLRLADLAELERDAALAERSLRRVVTERPLSRAAVERLSKLLARKAPRESVEVLWAYAKQLQPSDASLALLLGLADRAKAELADIELSAAILKRAVEISPSPLAVHRALATLYRDAGRTTDVAGELGAIAQLSLDEGDVDGALEAYGEVADLAEKAGRIDDALKTVASLRELCEEQDDPVRAAAYERRRAELFRDAKLDLRSAQESLEKSFDLHKSLETARAGVALARRRNDAEAEADWIERSVDLLVQPKDRAQALLALARLFDGPLNAAAQAEAALKEALRLDPSLEDAEKLLVAVLEREGRPDELAAHYEESAQKAGEPKAKAQLLLKAARLYRDHANRPDAAAAALLAARAASPDDAELTAQCADLLHQMGRAQEAAEFDALLLETDPFKARVFDRHAAFLREAKDEQALAALMLRRAERQEGLDAAESYLEAAGAFRRSSAEERAQLCEDQAFEKAPQHDDAFGAVRARRQGNPRKLAEVLARRAAAVPTEAAERLKERAQVLSGAGEALLAAEALDELLQVSPDDLASLAARADLAAEAGGPKASQPYDRRLLTVGGEALDPLQRLKSSLRLGHAALNAGAYQDAADALEGVIGLDPDGPRGEEALSLLAEVHSRTQNAPGLYRTSLKLSKKARPDEAEALLRRAAALFDDPAQAVDALVPLAHLRPSDTQVVSRAAAALRALEGHAELVDLLERAAQAQGGARAAEQLLEAAEVAAGPLADPARAAQLQRRAEAADPTNVAAVRAVANDQRQRGDAKGLTDTLGRLAELTRDPEEAALARLELAKLAVAQGDRAQARTLFERVVARGASGAGYAEALAGLTPLFTEAQDDDGLSQNLAARAELAPGAEQADLLLQAARHADRAGQASRAIGYARASVAHKPSAEGFGLLARAWRKGQPAKAAPAFVQAAQLSGPDARGPLLVEAADAWEAAGELTEAREVVERIAAELPDLLPPAELSARLERLGSAALALETGFVPAMGAEDFGRALKLAEDAKNPARIREALWALVATPAAEAHADRLADLLRKDSDAPELLRLARTLEKAQAAAPATRIYEGLAFGDPSEAQAEALARLLFIADSEVLLLRAVEVVSPHSPPELLRLVIEKVRALAPDTRAAALERCVHLLPERRAGLLRELVGLHTSARRFDKTKAALDELLEGETDKKARAALLLEKGELCWRDLADEAEGRRAFELALAEDASLVQAAEHLTALYRLPEDAAKLVHAWERLLAPEHGKDPASFGDKLEGLAAAYEAEGQNAAAARTWAHLAATPERTRKRAALAEALGNTGEALQLNEQVADTRGELEHILGGYLRANLIPLALRLSNRMLEDGPLPSRLTRLAAERFADSVEGPAVAARLWPALLSEAPADADGWTLYAEALRRMDKADAAVLADGFGAALTGSAATAPAAPILPIPRPAGEPWKKLPAGLVEVTATTMPRLHATLASALDRLGVKGLRLYLHPEGGAEAYLGTPDELVLGAGALSVFGPVELGFLCALALALGEHGESLSRPGHIPELDAAASLAFAANPASLAAARVIAVLDPGVRGMDGQLINAAQVFRTSTAFRAIARRALDLLSR